MADELTAQQQMAVDDRGGRLLVSAAAGSGKTKVLVDRLMKYVMDERDPANLDEFLIITYTKAAASELRGKIAAKLSEHLAQCPENRHLQRQMQRLYLTKISTVHGFCADLLKEYAYQLDLPADFRVADENECAELREAVMARMLDSAYENAERDPDFRAFVDGQGLGRDDRLVPEMLMKVYDSAQCHLSPDGWLDRCVEAADVEGLTDAAETLWGRELMESFFHWLDLQIEAIQNGCRLSRGAEGMEKVTPQLEELLAGLKYLRSAGTWDEIVARKDIDFPRWPGAKKCPDQALVEKIKAVRDSCKEDLKKKTAMFSDDSQSVLEDTALTAASVRGIIVLVRRFMKEFRQAKNSRRVLDFSDLEHRTLDLLMGKGRTGATVLAREIGRRYREIMVDEYQDSNQVQDAIFGALTLERSNCFMVGDVKQSIYQFRLADPTIFLEKYKAFRDAENAQPGQDRKVMLSANFRSGGAVLNSVNDIFRYCMSERVGGLVYGDDEALHEGISHEPLGEPEVELWGIDVQEHTYPEEAAFVAKRVRELTDGSHLIRDGKKTRPIEPKDVAILLRSPGSVGKDYIDALAKVGIPCATGAGEDLLQTAEIGVLRSLLQTVSNPRQDIPLIAVLVSPLFGFSADDLAKLRSDCRFGSIYDALTASDSEKAKRFLGLLDHLRREARMNTLAELMGEIFLLTGMERIYGAMESGALAVANLRTFYDYAARYESSARHDLEQFLEHLALLEEKGLKTEAAPGGSGAVTLMSIHKSKGLEFPVVFVCGLGRLFNQESTRAHVLCHQQLGLGLSAVDGVNRLRYPTIAKRAIAAKMKADSLSEEMRVLYVALTRARDRLIMTYAARNLESDLTDLTARMDLSPRELLTMDVKCPGQWVLMAALQRTEAGALHQLGGRPRETRLGEPVWKIGVVTAEPNSGGGAEDPMETASVPEKVLEQLQAALRFRYGHAAATRAPSKQTATQRKGRAKDEETAEEAPQIRKRSWRQPAFGKAKESATERGTAAHGVMQYIDYHHCGTAEQVRSQMEAMVEQGFLTQRQIDMVDAAQIAAFFATDLGRKVVSSETVREFKFSVLDPAEHFDPALAGEQILLQGVVDCAILEPDGITIIDFKTDAVTADTVGQRAESYRSQVTAYADAMARIYERPVKAAALYFFQTGDTVYM